MFSLHIDTARTWRGGQNQVLLTVNGLRAIGQRAALVAHPDGELRRRAAEGLELIPLAPRTEMDLSAAWQLSRVIKRLRARRHPRARPARRRDGVAGAVARIGVGEGRPAPALVAARRVDFHLKGNSFSRWKYRQVDCFIAASEAIRQMLVADGVPADRTVTVHEGIDVEHVARRAAGQRARGVLAAARRAGRRQRRRARAAQGPALPDRRRASRRAADARRALRHPRRRRAARAPRAAGARAPPREARAAARLPHRRARLHQGVRPVRDELGHRRARHVAARRDGLRARRSSRRAPAAFRRSSRTA